MLKKNGRCLLLLMPTKVMRIWYVSVSISISTVLQGQGMK